MGCIKQGYTNDYGQKFDNIRDIHFNSLSDLRSGLGKYLLESHQKDSKDSFSLGREEGVYIYRSIYNPKKAFRLCKEYRDYKYAYCFEEKLVSKLQEKQPNVKLTEFPTAIITIENKCVGQEIPWYDNYVALRDAFDNKELNKVPTYYFLKTVEILKELVQNGIYYKDVHARNFMVNTLTDDVKLIDFDSGYIRFDEDRPYSYKTVLHYLKMMLNKLSQISNVDLHYDINKEISIEEIENRLQVKHYELTKKNS